VNGLFLLDTNILSEPLRPQPDPKVLEKMREHQARLTTASIVWHEMLFGCYRLPESARRIAIERYLFDVVRENIPIFDYDARAAAWHAAERARLARIGRTPSFVDGQIAAIARVNDCTLVTANVGHFEGFQELQLEDWRKSRKTGKSTAGKRRA
jgi:tRNA(fMet)-specific endonuclease VapC